MIYLLILNHRCLQSQSACATARSIVLRCRGWASCFACAIVCGFFAAEGRTALRAQSVVALKKIKKIVASFLRMVELLRLRDRSWVCCRGWPRFGCTILDDSVWIRGLRSKSADPRFAQQILGSDVCVRNPRIIAPKLGSEACAAKS